MTQKQRHELLGVSKSTYSDWKNPSNPKHNLYLLIKNLNFLPTVKLLQNLKEKENSLADNKSFNGSQIRGC